MATEFGNIDDMLIGGTSPSIPPTSESKDDYQIADDAPDNDLDTPEPTNKDDFYSTPKEKSIEDEKPFDEPQEKETDSDDYGNPKEKPRTYTEEEVNEMFRKRFKNRTEEEVKPTPQQYAQAEATGFEYNPESNDNWEVQLKHFVKQTVSQMQVEEVQKQNTLREKQAHVEFQDKFIQGMEKFNDFKEIVASQPIDDAMTLALREISNPAAFIYAASKRQPQELERISKISNPNARYAEMIRLEERMKKAAQGTKAPKPISRSSNDASIPVKAKPKEPSIEDLIASSDAKRRAQMTAKRGR
jgi:hypothetical protein